MKFPALLLLASVCAFLAACSSLELSSEGGGADRVVNGTVVAHTPLPAGAQVLVRLVDNTPREAVRAVPADMAMPDDAKPIATERIIAQEPITVPVQTMDPVPFRIEFRATDAELRHGLNLEARISYGGKVQHRTINARVVTLASVPYSHAIEVEPVQ
jgi:uncharacterized lipoprotein YbaY